MTGRVAQVPAFARLLREVRACGICAAHLPLGPRPFLQLDPRARILVASQAPGSKAHMLGVPFADASGDRLREWMGLTNAQFYDPALLAIVPMGLCYPGTGAAGDLPPRPECAVHWRKDLLATLPALQLTLVIGSYAQAWHLPGSARSVTERVAAWRDAWPRVLPLPHPSGRNNLWLQRNPWFADELLPALRARVAVLRDGAD
ncbi:MAG: uracil-DNA glycosylase family protein [Betaproteobacteria bacterium]